MISHPCITQFKTWHHRDTGLYFENGITSEKTALLKKKLLKVDVVTPDATLQIWHFREITLCFSWQLFYPWLVSSYKSRKTSSLTATFQVYHHASTILSIFSCRTSSLIDMEAILDVTLVVVTIMKTSILVLDSTTIPTLLLTMWIPI